MRRCGWLLGGLVLVFALGCEQPTGAPPVGGSAPPNAPPPPPSSVTSVDGPPEIPEAPKTEAAVEPANIGPDGGQETAEFEREVAQVGVGKRGRNYGGGIITEPIRQNFLLRHRIVFLKIEQDLRVFKAANDRLPNSHEEFMEEIINASNIPLPDLPAGERYVYDPEQGQLMVERPRPSQGQP